MFMRLFLLLSLIGHVGPTAADKEKSYGGRAMSAVLVVVVGLGVIALATLVVLAILALSGQFENNLVDPVV